MLNWIEVNMPSIHGITRLRCGLYLCIENTPGSWQAVKMGIWGSVKGMSKEQAIQECELHYLTERLKGNKYRPGRMPVEEQAITNFYAKKNTPDKIIQTIADAVEDGGHEDDPEDAS